MEEIAFMPFIFWSGLAFLLGCAFCVHFDVFGFRRRLTKSFLSVFDFVLPNTDSRGRRMKFGMAKTASYIFAVILFLLLASIFLSSGLPYATGDEENKHTGPLGDLFNGILTPVLTFLTFCGLLVTILIQNIQMKATLQELELTRKEMSESTEALQAQVENSTAQKFDSNFYELLKLHNNLADKLKSNIKLINDEFDEFNKKSTLWDGFACPDELRSFFLINYQLLKFIKNNEDKKIINATEAKKYANIARAMLSESLYALIFINCIIPRFAKYRELIERYHFFEHLVFARFNDPYVLKVIHCYDISAFGDRENLHDYLTYKKIRVLDFLGQTIFESIEVVRDVVGLINILVNLNDNISNRNLDNRKNDILSYGKIIEEIKNKIDLNLIFNNDGLLKKLINKDQKHFLVDGGFDIGRYLVELKFMNEEILKFRRSFSELDYYIQYLEKLSISDV